MSVVKINTNVPASLIDEELLVQTTECLAKTLKTSKSNVMVFINSDLPIVFSCSDGPAALVTVSSVEGINEVDNKAHSAALFPLLTKYLKVNEDRISIVFNAVEPHAIGVNGKTLIQ